MTPPMIILIAVLAIAVMYLVATLLERLLGWLAEDSMNQGE